MLRGHSSSSQADQHRRELRAALVGLSVACPFSQDNPPTCQLCQLRTRPMAERLAWVNSLSTEEMATFYKNHQDCLQRLERSRT